MRVNPKEEDHKAKKTNFVIKCHVNGIFETRSKWFSAWDFPINMLVFGRRIGCFEGERHRENEIKKIVETGKLLEFLQ